MCGSVDTASRIKIIEHKSSFYGIVCQHCESAPCIKICPTDAISDEKVDTEKCIGCGLCVMVCPFGAMTYTASIAEKSDLCAVREEGPACIKACTKRAISILDPAKVKAKNQQIFLSKLAGVYEPDQKKGGIVHVLTSQARARLVLEE
jgi:carbon-monoxide dehydrogenase iron sulfur subunit